LWYVILHGYHSKLKGITSEHSDQLAFIDQPWVNIIDGKVRATYYFKHDEELLVIESTGITRKGTWELLPNIDSIWRKEPNVKKSLY